MRWLFIAAATALLRLTGASTGAVVCYHGVWSSTRAGNGRFTVADINPHLCTHLIYSFIGIHPTGELKQLSPELDNNGNIARFNALKLQNPALKTLVAIGGWNEGSAGFSAAASSPASRARFVQSALAFVQTWGFDGFDLDWEYPARGGGAAADIVNYRLLLEEFRKVWDQNGLLLTAAVSATPDSIDASYDVPAMSKNLDLINVMAYDLHGSWDAVTGQNAPLYAGAHESAWQRANLNVEASIRHWIGRGADPGKITLGLGFYGRSFLLINEGVNGVGAATSNWFAGDPGPYTGEAGMLGYNEITEKLNTGLWTTVWDDVQKVPYSYKGNQWVGYDNEKSIKIKVEFAKSLNLAGAMIWSIETDDFRGVSGKKFALLQAVNEAIGNKIENPQPAPEPEEPAPEQEKPAPEPVKPVPEPEKPAPEPEPPLPVNSAKPTELCSKTGYVRDPINCEVYYYCMEYNNSFISFPFTCNANLYYDPETQRCDYPQNVVC